MEMFLQLFGQEKAISSIWNTFSTYKQIKVLNKKFSRELMICDVAFQIFHFRGVDKSISFCDDVNLSKKLQMHSGQMDFI